MELSALLTGFLHEKFSDLCICGREKIKGAENIPGKKSFNLLDAVEFAMENYVDNAEK